MTMNLPGVKIVTTAVVLLSILPVFAETGGVERKFIEAGLVDIHSVDASIQVDLVNSDPGKNFFREDFYHGLNKAYLRKAAAVKLSRAQRMLKEKHPHLSLQVLDAARPRSVSARMYEKMKGTKYQRFVADPRKGSMHNYGMAVDITIADAGGKRLDMGFSPFNKSTAALYWQFAKMKLGFGLTDTQKKNRRLLLDVMTGAGFLPLAHEWWHFNTMPKDEVRRRFEIIE